MKSPEDELARSHERLLIVFGVLAAALLIATAAIRTTDSFSEYGRVRERYNRLAAAQSKPAIPIRIDQIWAPEAAVADRCGSCHMTAVGAPALSGDGLFAAHPSTPHDPSTFGCTPCHGGYGRAVSQRIGHHDGGDHAEPLIPMAYVEASCGVCHTGIAVRDRERVARGRVLFQRAHCQECHKPDGDTRSLDLRFAGLTGYARDWHAWEDAASDPASRATDHANAEALAAAARLDPDERAAVEAFLDTRVGAPKLVEGKALFHELGCLGCHRATGVGGVLGRDLSDIGRVALTSDAFPNEEGAQRRADWLRSVLLHPADSTPDTLMRPVLLAGGEMDALLTFLLSLRPGPSAVTAWPQDRLRVERLREHDFEVDGQTLFLAFCSGCHGAEGQGSRLGNGTQLAVPSIGGATFLGLVSDAQIERTIRSGRPDSTMPAWGAPVSGLHKTEIAAIVLYLRGRQPAAVDLTRFRETTADLPAGRALFQRHCATCHGTAGEGTAVAPPLGAADNPVSHNPTAIYGTLMTGIEGTAMGAFRGLDVQQVRALAAAVDALPVSPSSREGWQRRAGRGAVGEGIFDRVCARCHADLATPLRAPRILSPSFLASVDDGFLTACVARRHQDLPELGDQGLDLSADDIADVVAYLRSLAPRL